MTIAMLHTVDDLWLDRCPVPMRPDRAKNNLWTLLKVQARVPRQEWPEEKRLRLNEFILEVFRAYPNEAPGWYQAWRQANPRER